MIIRLLATYIYLFMDTLNVPKNIMTGNVTGPLNRFRLVIKYVSNTSFQFVIYLQHSINQNKKSGFSSKELINKCKTMINFNSK